LLPAILPIRIKIAVQIGFDNQVRDVKKWHAKNSYLMFSNEAFMGADPALSDKMRGLRSTLDVTNSGTLYVFKNVS
jgi:hypothetical protein